MSERRTSIAKENLRKLENLIRASNEIINEEEEDSDEIHDDPHKYKYEILGHNEADWDSMELQLSPDKQSSISTIEQLSRLAREEDTDDLPQEKQDWQIELQVLLHRTPTITKVF